ncbi:hypothetical protein OC842_006185, partial [Tilletia horrida]
MSDAQQHTGSTSKDAPVDAVAPAVPVGDEKNFPQTAKEAPITGIIPSKDVPFKDQVAGHAKYYAGLVTRNDKEIQQGAARVRGDDLVDEPAASAKKDDD